MRWDICARTDVGRTRERNEDNYLVYGILDHDETEVQDGPDGILGSTMESSVDESAPAGLVVVADGMGGHANGNVAALAAVETLRGWFRPRRRQAADPERAWVEAEGLRALAGAIGQANFDIFRKNRGAFSIEGMGTTIVALLFYQRFAVAANVGDSRIYLYRDHHLRQVTKDHSLIEELIRYNIIGQDDAFLNPNKNIITRALGMSETVEVDAQVLDVEAGDIWLLCSDGLTDMVDNKWMEMTLREADAGTRISEVTNELVDCANERGGIDNITLILARCLSTAPDPT